MPYKEGNKWRATPVYKGQRLQTKQFKTKKEAVEYEREQKRKAKNIEKRQQSGMDLLSFCNRYLDHATRYTEKVYKEKIAVCQRILKE